MTSITDHINDLKAAIAKFAPEAKVEVSITNLPLSVLTAEVYEEQLSLHTRTPQADEAADSKYVYSFMRYRSAEDGIEMESKLFNPKEK